MHFKLSQTTFEEFAYSVIPGKALKEREGKHKSV